jgi:hypothetical protein
MPPTSAAVPIQNGRDCEETDCTTGGLRDVFRKFFEPELQNVAVVAGENESNKLRRIQIHIWKCCRPNGFAVIGKAAVNAGVGVWCANMLSTFHCGEPEALPNDWVVEPIAPG